METKNHYRLVLTAPIKSDYIYNTDKIEKAGKKALSYLSKKYNISQSLITLKDLDTLDEYSFMASKKVKNNKLYGGAAITQPASVTAPQEGSSEFLKKISTISKSIDQSVDSLQAAVQEKEKNENDNNIVMIAKNGVAQLTSINTQLQQLNTKLDTFGGKAGKLLPQLSQTASNTTTTSQPAQTQGQALIEEDKATVDKEKKELAQAEEKLKETEQQYGPNEVASENLLEPSLGSQSPNENLCTIM
ncbi:hypothetical protein CPAV1605_403 [seawater metagenome]|uniref:Uncharacterized protein n=1 Tax=seawater metagenome TaxID=1561972 RepID=A0A5E8CGY0_9ZZZZ